MSKHTTPKNTPVTTADAVAEDGKFSAIAAATADVAKRIASAGDRMARLVDEIAPTVFLAYSTGYVHTERTSKDNPLPLGAVRQNDYVKMFTGKHGDPITVTTLKRWRRFGALQSAGIETDSTLYRTLKRSGNVDKFADVLDVAKPSRKAIESLFSTLFDENGKPKAIESGNKPDSGDKGDESGETRAPQVSDHAPTQTEMVSVFVALVAGLDPESMTPDEYAMTVEAHRALADKFAAYDKVAAAA